MSTYSVTPVAQIPILDALIKKYLLSHPDLEFHNKDCFRNAWKLMRISSNIEYVEGYSFRMIGNDTELPFHHAWNMYKGVVFDFTSDSLHDGNIGSGLNKYLEVFRTNSRSKARSLVLDKDVETRRLIWKSFPQVDKV